LWRCARSFLRRLCLLIFDFRRFFSEPISSIYLAADRPHTGAAPRPCLPAPLREVQPIVSITITCEMKLAPSSAFAAAGNWWARLDTAITHRGPKSEIRHPKPETNPKHEEGNDQNPRAHAGFEHWAIGHLNLFRVSNFGFRISARCMVVIPRCTRNWSATPGRSADQCSAPGFLLSCDKARRWTPRQALRPRPERSEKPWYPRR
jgi:hypothetical protein